ncbi:MAG TPA: quinol dehydrogenase ferredoxin subunit NapH [Zoogloea sp.]|uniref:quinol dehydrogenase ferredoxin subunit NapH n=1 Tax=Zoogloea sp. TaxID=49181 RepID=UPI002C0BB5EE|nr:quinol dehydrogenase ferredoxin subunit NapH [Zoogloea sp.]HMV62430.1 quinol dehydrogenase ferredoxin subunit NapH [Rhodocyclaceae bacterium]HMZ76624.1 quinol dehydrogenase ferredoxin subunit NapH [Rhodocyclaceae bacterium]HNA68116.1 quinol dehydrogenase ferredoxin subunit NapH [Rhodocyclaceae bacterium]HNB64405.1 quinol dehydrogenase ferredoxin subunit NapH [Rhodocyclaceae bacterium]HNC80830.1 quinol dehydrogenase ferredoxin subunit NapH [Rhodocyclaceae bacterium]
MATAPSCQLSASPSADRRSLWQRQRWLILRRLSQASILLLFLAGPWFGLWLVKGNLSSSLTLDVLPLTDPLLLLQTLVTGHVPEATAFLGAALVTGFYLLVGGRVFCGWVCPVNIVTDAAAWTRRRLGIKTGRVPDAATRLWLLAGVLGVAAVTGRLAWEWVNPVSLLHRSLIFGLGGGLWMMAAIFLYDVLVASRGWCGHLCPMGAFYGLLGQSALVRVSAHRRKACDDCMDCFAVCPEPQVIRPALKQAGQTHPLILSADCTTCGRCIDVCDKQVFKMTHRFDQRSE